MFYDFFIHYCKSSLNLTDESSHQSDYSYLVDPDDEQSQIDKLMSLLINKLATAVLRVSKQLCHVKNDDSIVGPVDRDEAHTRGLLHRAGMVFVLSPDGKILLARRSPSKDTFPDTYDCACAFHVTFGESYEEAAKRELREETGIHATPEYLDKFSFHDPPEHEMVAIFKCRSNEPIVIDRTESIRAEFYSANGVDSIISSEHVTPWLKIGWKLVREKIA